MSLNYPSSEADAAVAASLAQGYWVRMTGQMERIQATLDALQELIESSSHQVEALLRHLTDPARSRAIEERLADLLAGQEAGQEQWRALADHLDELSQALARLNRTQFKSNALAEMKDQQVTTALSTLQDVVARREQTQEARAAYEQERAAALRAEARGEFAANLLPVLDGIEMALENGRAWLAQRRAKADDRQAQPAPAAPSAGPGFWQRLRWALTGRGLPPGMAASAASAQSPAGEGEMLTAVESWLQGLELVRTRFLALLATADIYPIEAEAQPFDPHLHLALAAAARPDLPDGAVVSVLRKGYRQRERVLRFAEVTVNRLAAAADEAPPREEAARPAPSDAGYISLADN